MQGAEETEEVETAATGDLALEESVDRLEGMERRFERKRGELQWRRISRRRRGPNRREPEKWRAHDEVLLRKSRRGALLVRQDGGHGGAHDRR